LDPRTKGKPRSLRTLLKRNDFKWESLIVCSDPQHRVFRLQKEAPSLHPDFKSFISDCRMVFWRLSCPPFPLGAHLYQPTISNSTCLCSESVDVLRFVIKSRSDHQKCVEYARKQTDNIKMQIREFLRGQEVLGSSIWCDNFESPLPVGCLMFLSKVFQCSVHPRNDCYAFREESEYVKEISSLQTWYEFPKEERAARRLPKSDLPAESAEAPFKSGITLNVKVAEELRLCTTGPLLQSLMAWHEVAQRYNAAGTRLKVGTTNVEGAIYVIRLALRLQDRKTQMTEERLSITSKLVAMALNVYMLNQE